MRLNDKKFFNQKAKYLAPKLLGKILCRNYNGQVIKSKIVEVEAYTGTQDSACHSSKKKSSRTSVMWEDGGKVYVYLCYGMHYMLNIVCAGKDPEAVLIRGVQDAIGPGRLTKFYKIDKSLNGEDIKTSSKIWLEEGENIINYKSSPRIGINYAEQKDREALLRFYL
jgi:DNA-3-methyladenine glycosylase